MKTREEKLLLSKLWAVMIDKGSPCHPDAQWYYYGGGFSLLELKHKSWLRNYSSSDNSFLTEDNYSKSDTVKQLKSLSDSELMKQEKNYVQQQKSLIASLPDSSLPLLKPDWDLADVPLYFEEGEFVGTDCDSEQIAIFRGSLPLKSGDKIHLYIKASSYHDSVNQVLHLKSAIEEIRSGKEAEDLVKKVFGNIEDTL